MSVRLLSTSRFGRGSVLGSSALLVLLAYGEAARAQVALPQVTVSGNKEKPKPQPAPRRVVAVRPPAAAPVTAAQAAAAKNNAFDAARSNLYTTVGTTS